MDKPDTVYKAEVIDISAEGSGIVKMDKLIVFLNEGIEVVVGDGVMFTITEMRKKFAYGKTVKINTKSGKRRKSQCRYSKGCGGCALQLMRYKSQLALKRKIVSDALFRIAGIGQPLVQPTIGMRAPVRYRNKAQFPVGQKGEIGFFKGRTHQVVDCVTCMLQSKVAEKVAAVMRLYIKEKEITPYSFDKKQGLLRHIIVRTGLKTGEVMVVLVINSVQIPDWSDLPERLERGVSEVKTGDVIWKLKSVVINFNRENNMNIMGDTCAAIYGKDRILEILNGKLFEISPNSFFQVNPVQSKVLYDTIMRYADLTGNETVIDLYCGVGIIGIQLAHKAKQVIGIEKEASAVIDARINAQLNHIENIEFIENKAEIGFSKLLRDIKKVDVLVIDPPRNGCDRKLLDAIAQIKAKRIIYVSCNPATMARDIKLFVDVDYRFVMAQPVDMFPNTMSIECVTLLEHV